MSTDLYGARVLALEPEARRMRLRIFVVYYDTGYASHQPIPSDRSFFVRLLCDYDALGDDIAQSERFDEAYVDANAFRYVERFVELERRNFPVADYAGYADFYYERDGAWQDEERLVQADYDVFVTKPEYLAPFRVGQSWGTTAYPTEADALSEAEAALLPEFGDARWFTPFPAAADDASVARSMRFSADGTLLLVGHGEGGFAVFRVDDGSLVRAVEAGGGWEFSPGWTHDGRVAGKLGGQGMAWTLEGGDAQPFAPCGCAANSTGTRFFNLPHDETLQLLDETGRVLYEREGAPDWAVYAAFDAAARRCAFVVESEPLRVLDIDTGVVEELEHMGLRELAMSPDGRYVAAVARGGFVVVRLADGVVVRRRKTSGYATAIAWSPDGQLLATSATNPQGEHSRIALHRSGAALAAALAQPTPLPAPGEHELGELARLFAVQTAGFSPGWDSHVDDNLLDLHVSVARMGGTIDLVAAMRSGSTKVAARSYEALVAQQRGEHERARAALADAEARVAQLDVDAWAMTFVWAPLAAARFVLGDRAGAETALEHARVELDDEANAFQKRAVLARALLTMGHIDEVGELARADEASWVSDFHVALLLDLVDAGELALARELVEHWNLADEWSARQQLCAHLRACGIAATALGLEDEDDDDDADDDDADAPDDADARVAWLGKRGRWSEAYAIRDATKPTLRGAIDSALAEAACRREDLHILLDALARLSWTDMNSPGVRALQDAFKRLAGRHYRAWHP